jgi:energy-coupling factor transport system substrate-specific component
VTWQLSSFAILALLLVLGFGWYERRRPPARVVALVAVLAALAVVGRLAFAAIPNVKPTTDIVLFAGYALGPIPGFAVGSITALVSNVFLGQGPWTAWQMVGWGACGVGGALLAQMSGGRDLGRVPLAIACGVAGLAFGAFMDVYQWTLAAQQDLATYLAISGTSLPYNLAHAVGNVGFCLLIGPIFIRSLRRYRQRFEVHWDAPARAVGATRGVAVAALAALAISTGLTVPTEAARADGQHAQLSSTPAAQLAAASPAKRAVRYLAAAQNRDGGFGGGRGLSSNQLYTGWAALGLAAARRNPRDQRRAHGRAITRYLRSQLGGLTDIGEIERTVLVLRAAGVSPRSFGGRDLVADIERRRRPNGSIAEYVSYTAFGVLALKASGAPIWGAATTYLERSQNSDGGFGIAPDTSSDTDMTGAVLQALAVVGRGGGEASRRGVEYLVRMQSPNGGFGATEGRDPNAQSTSYAVQGLLAVRGAPATLSRAISYLKRLQRSDGSFRYSSSSDQTPVWVTAQVLMALRRKPLPLAALPRKKRPRASAAATPSAEGTAEEDAAARGGKKGSTAGGRYQPNAAAEEGAETTAAPAASTEQADSQLASAAADGADEEGGGSTTLIVLGVCAALILAGMLPWRVRAKPLDG